jgi:DNA-binding MarR family transcriptional regulator
MKEEALGFRMNGDAAVPPAEESADLRLDDHLPFLLARAAEAVGRLVARSHEERFGLGAAEWRVLARLAEADGPVALAQGRGAEDAGARRAARGLMWRGLAEAGPHGVTLTEEGRRAHLAIAHLVQAYEAALVSGLSPGEASAVKQLLRRVATAAERLGGEGT